MKENKEHIIKEMNGGKEILPLYEFFIVLKRNNFLVTPKQIADSNSILSYYSGMVNNEQELCNYLSPIFANSQEEQIQFREIFDQHFKEKIHPDKVTEELTRWQKMRTGIKKNWWKYVLLFVSAVLIIVLIQFLIPKKSLPALTISLVVDSIENKNKIPVSKPNRQINVSVVYTVEEKQNRTGASLQPIKPVDLALQATYNWGDNTPVDTLSTHIYTTEGNFTITAIVAVLRKNKFLYADTVTSNVAICLADKSVSIEKSFKGDSVKIGDKILLRAVANGRQPDSVIWSKEEDINNGNIGYGKELTTSFDAEGVQTIYCDAYYDSTHSPCNEKSQISFFVYDPNPKPVILLNVPGNAKIIHSKYRVQPKWYYLVSAFTLLSLFLTTFLAKRWVRSKKEKASENADIKQEYEKLIQSFSVNPGMSILPFQSKNYLPLPEAEIGDVARYMRKRINDDATYLHLPKTIAKAIVRAGYFEPVMATRTQQSEYLVLIDENHPNSQQVKLIEYLLELLGKQNVFIEKYYYRKDPKTCYQTTPANPISLEKLSEKYPKHILLIFGDAQQLVYPLYPVIDSSYLPLINRWQFRAVLTPVPFMDWGNKEKKVLPEELPVLPVHIQGLLLIFKKLFDEEINILAELQQYSSQFYETESIDFEDLDELEAYCANAGWSNVPGGGKYSGILFQWIAALAVYPKIRWECTLAIGKAIMDKYGKTNEMNFTTLLRIARIQWMKDGQFPDYTRLNLLKNLTIENEVTARETILTLLHEIPASDLNSDHSSYEEKETQRLINEFNLYAYDPVKYAGYKKSRDFFELLRAGNQLMDQPAKMYFENAGLEWNTLIYKQNKTGSFPEGAENSTLENYFEIAGTGNFKWLYFWSAAISAILFIAGLIGLAGLLILNFSNSKKFPTFSSASSFNKEIKFTYTDTSGAKQAGIAVLTIDTASASLENGKPVLLQVPINDSLKSVSISINNNPVFDTLLPVTYDAYNFTLTNNSPPGPLNTKTVARILLTGNCVSNLDKYAAIIREADPEMEIYDSTVSENSNQKSSVCLNQVSYGKNVDVIKLNALRKSFNKIGIDLKINTYPGYPVGDNEIVMYKSPAQGTSLAPVVFIQVSDQSLRSSANAFRKELQSNRFEVKTVEQQNYNYNSEIYYYNDAMRTYANTVKQYYDRYFPDLKIPVKLRKPTSQVNTDNMIVVWIRKYEPGPQPELPVAQFEIRNSKMPSIVNANQLLNVSFDIVNTNNGKITANRPTGRICIYSEPGCTEFSFDPGNGTNNISRQININSQQPGRHEVRVMINDFTIDQSLGYFTIREQEICDTMHAYIGKGDGNVNYGGEYYVGAALTKKGITLSLIEKNSKSGVIEITKDKCPVQRVTVTVATSQKVTFCDGAILSITLLNWENQPGNIDVEQKKASVKKAFNKNAKGDLPADLEAIFDAILCKPKPANAVQTY